MISKIQNIQKFLPSRKYIGNTGANLRIGFSVYISCPESVHIEDNTLIRQGTCIIIAPTEHLYKKKYTVVDVNNTIVTNGHKSTVCIPHILLGASHINDKSSDIFFNENVRICIKVIIIAGARLGIGCICGAYSTITKPVHPYALVYGTPARIVDEKFSINQILKHERILLTENERVSCAELEDLFEKYYSDKKVFGVETIFRGDEIAAIRDAAKQRSFVSEYLIHNLTGERVKLIRTIMAYNHRLIA